MRKNLLVIYNFLKEFRLGLLGAYAMTTVYGCANEFLALLPIFPSLPESTITAPIRLSGKTPKPT